MKNKIGLIGVGHIGQYLVTGLLKADMGLQIYLASPSREKVKSFIEKTKCFFSTNNQDVVDKAQIIILATRLEHIESALAGVSFRPDQIVVSIAAGVTLETLAPLVSPARPVRALPISCVSINKSPVLMFPEDQNVREVFSLVGQVHLIPNEDAFTSGTALVGAFYAWLFLLMQETTSWTADQGIDADLSRKLVIETIEGACAMAKEQNTMSLTDIWQTLATPGGISEQGANVIKEQGGFASWYEALDVINRRMKG
jgi:pyrroline-5-carboxylate reductase